MPRHGPGSNPDTPQASQVRKLSAIILVMDRVGAGHLGPYGGESIPTPALNRLAAESFLFEHALVESTELSSLYQSAWQCCHPLCRANRAGVSLPSLSLPRAVGEQGYTSVFVTDDKQLANHPLVDDFEQSVLFDRGSVSEPAESVERSALARFLDQTLEHIPTSEEPFVLWVHSQGMQGPWDAPLELRQQFLDDEDPDAYQSTIPPDLRLEDGFDPDELLPLSAAYAAQVMMLDMCLDRWWKSLRHVTKLDEHLLMLLGSRGFPLGEHRDVGAAGDSRLYEESIHVPWLVRLPDGTGAALRSQNLVQMADISATLLEWTGAAVEHEGFGALSQLSAIRGEGTAAPKYRAVATSASACVLRIPAWCYRNFQDPTPSAAFSKPVDDEAFGHELYAKPDDRWEFNDVAGRCPEVADLLSAELIEFQRLADQGQLNRLDDLPDRLVVPAE